MSGFIYIASAFETVNRSTCGRKGSWVDNDPHFWTDPPTWGICRNDLRARSRPGYTIFFVLPKNGRHPQCIFGYLTIDRIVTHLQAYRDPRLISKRMSRKVPNGNIIVTATGRYNRFDARSHFHKWQKISKHYAVGKTEASKFLTSREVRKKAPTFVPTLVKIIGRSGPRAIDVITRKGTHLTDLQVRQLINWISS